jgi:hypothetical protein
LRRAIDRQGVFGTAEGGQSGLLGMKNSIWCWQYVNAPERMDAMVRLVCRHKSYPGAPGQKKGPSPGALATGYCGSVLSTDVLSISGVYQTPGPN